MHESTHARGVRRGDQRRRAVHIDAPQFVPVAAALVAVTEMGGGMKHHIAAGQRVGEGADLAHVALHHLHLRQIRELLARLVHGSGQRPNLDAARRQLAHQVVAQQARGAGDEGLPDGPGRGSCAWTPWLRTAPACDGA